MASKSDQSLKYADESFPDWVTPFTRRLCQKLGAPTAIPHVFAGTHSILRSMKEHQSKGLKDVKVAALLVAVVFFVYSRLDGAEIEPAILSTKFADSREVVEEFRNDGVEIGSLSDSDIKMHIRTVVAEQGTRMEWFQNIRVGSGLGGTDDDAVSSDKEQRGTREADDEPTPRPKKLRYEPPPSGVEYLKPGLGTMMQPKFDYLSEESLEGYAVWEADIRRRIHDSEQANENKMDIDEG